MPRRRQVAALAAVIAALVAVAPTAALPLGGSHRAQPQGLVASLWGALTSFWGAAGCEIDPNGRCMSSRGATLPAQLGRGHGQGRLVNIRGANGCEIDPNGRLVSPTGGTCGAAVGGGTPSATAR